MLRSTGYKQLIRILKGEDLEFRITQYAIKVSGVVVLEDMVFPHALTFRNCQFDQVEFRNCKFLGDISFKGSRLNRLTFSGCQLKDVDVEKCHTQKISLVNSVQVQKFHIGASDINHIEITGNPAFEAFEVACENNILTALIENNGQSSKNSFKSTIYICPERFDQMTLKNNRSEILHVGTIGQFSSFEIDGYNANLVLFSNCNGNNANVHFQGLQPIDVDSASVCIVNSDRVLELRQSGVFNSFRNIKNYEQPLQHRNYTRIAG